MAKGAGIVLTISMGKDLRSGSSRRNGVRHPANDRPWSRLEPALLALHEATELNRLWKAIVRLVGLALPHHHMVAALPFEGMSPMALRTTVPHDDIEAFWRRLHSAEPPLFKFVERFPGVKLCDLDALMGEKELMQSRFYQEVMVSHGWRHSAALLFWDQSRLLAHVEVLRTGEQGGFTGKENKLLLALHPHLDAAIRRVALIARHELLGMLLKETFEHPENGVAIMDSQGRVLFQNQTATAICAVWVRGQAAAAENFCPGKPVDLPDCVREKAMQLMACFLADFKSKSLKGVSIESQIPHPNGEAVSARARVIAPKLRSVQPHIRIEFFQLRHNEAARLSDLPVYRLSPCEHRVALLVARGMRNHEVAAGLGLSVNTVRAHLREIFYKLGVTHRGQIQQRLAKGEPPAGPDTVAHEFHI